MTDIEYRNTLYEVDKILSILDKTLYDKIPENIKLTIKENKADDYNFELDYSKKLNEQKLLETTELFLTALYIKYWCDEQRRADTIKIIKENDMRAEKELQQKYSVDNLFNNIENSKNESKELMLVKPKNIFHKIIEKIIEYIKNNLRML